MARSVVSRAVVVRQKYYWPDLQLNIWTLIMLLTGSLLLGVFAEFMQIQNQMRLRNPWLFPFGVTVGTLTILFILLELILIAQRRLLPGLMMIGSFVLFALFLTGVIGTAIQLFGSEADVNAQCQNFVDDSKSFGPTVQTLAYLEQSTICACWRASFAFWIIGSVFLVWMMIMAFQVSRDEFD